MRSSCVGDQCHGHSERAAAPPPPPAAAPPATAAGLLPIRQQRVHHLYDGPDRGSERAGAQGGAVQDVAGHGGDRGGGAADSLHHRALCLPEHVHLTGKELLAARCETKHQT